MMMMMMMMIITELTRNVFSLNEAVKGKSNLEAGNSAAAELQREGRTSKHRVPANHMLRLFSQSSSLAIPWRQKNIRPGAPRGRAWWRQGNGGAASSVAPGGGELDRHLSIRVIFGLFFLKSPSLSSPWTKGCRSPAQAVLRWTQEEPAKKTF